MNDDITEIIRNHQKSLSLNDIQFVGEKDKSLWSHIKAGRKHPGEKFLRRVGNQYPALQPAIIGYLFPPAETAMLGGYETREK